MFIKSFFGKKNNISLCLKLFVSLYTKKWRSLIGRLSMIFSLDEIIITLNSGYTPNLVFRLLMIIGSSSYLKSLDTRLALYPAYLFIFTLNIAKRPIHASSRTNDYKTNCLIWHQVNRNLDSPWISYCFGERLHCSKVWLVFLPQLLMFNVVVLLRKKEPNKTHGM